MRVLKIVSKANFGDHMDELMSGREVVAPVEREEGKFSFEPIQSLSEAVTEGYVPTLNPPKKYFLPPEETLFKFRVDNGSEVSSGAPVAMEAGLTDRPLIIFGIRPCDIVALDLLDRTFADTYVDTNYLSRRENVLLVGMDCMEPCDEHCFCSAMDSLNVDRGFDLLLTDFGDDWVLAVGSPRGREFMMECKGVRELTRDERRRYNSLLAERDGAFEASRARLKMSVEELPAVLSGTEDSPVWGELADKCFGCGRCNLVCPTCYCFDVREQVSLDLKSGERKRYWDGCTLLEFAAVAGGENFRSDRSARLRHRFYRKGKYLSERYGHVFCVGCGRCVRTCLVDIDPVETWNSVLERAGGEDR